MAATVPVKPRRARKPKAKPVLPPLPDTWEGRLDHFANFCSKLKLESGEPMFLHDFQRWILAPYFRGYVETAICIPTGNGKTSLMGALALWHCLTVPYKPNVILAAAARDQATKMLGQAGGFVERTEWLQEHFKLQLTGQKRIIHNASGGFIQAIAADATTADGEIPSLVCVDELHRHKSSELYGVLRDKCAKLRAQLGETVGILSISTAGDSEESPLGQVRKRALALPTCTRIGVKVSAEDLASGFAWREYSLEDGDDHENFELVARANPLPIHDPESLRKRYASPTMEPWQWARFTCGLWVGGENAAFDTIAWRDCGVKNGPEPGEHICLGVDLAGKYDSSAFVPWLYDAEEDLEVVGKAIIIEAPTDGSSTRYDAQLEAILEINERNPIDVIVADHNAGWRYLWEMALNPDAWPKWLRAKFPRADLSSIEAREHSQDPSPMSEAAMGLGEAIRAGRIVHPYDDGGLTKHIEASKAQSTSGERWRIVKHKGGRKIDAAIALAIVRNAMTKEPKRPKVTAATYAGWQI